MVAAVSADPAKSVAPPWARRATAAAPARERARRRLVVTVFVVYLLLIFEGSIRKWVVPELGLLVFFIRDPFVLYAYSTAFLHNLWPRRSPWLLIFGAMALVGMLLGAVQLAQREAGATEVMLTIYGWRSYFLYPPLALLIGAQLRM